MKRDRKGRFARKHKGMGIKALVIPLVIVGGLYAAHGIAVAIASVEPEPVVVDQTREREPREVRIRPVVDWDTPGRIEKEIRELFSHDPQTAVAVAKAESLFKKDAYNPEWHYDKHGNRICQGSYGVFQIACVHEIENPEKLYDVAYNLKRAQEIHTASGWRPWGAYTDGNYRKYME